jgi:hypothetical protein
MSIIGVPHRHRAVIVTATQGPGGSRGWLLGKKFFPELSFIARLLIRGAPQNRFSKAPTPEQVSRMLRELTQASSISEARKLGAFERVAGSGVRLHRHYFEVGDPAFWESPGVQSHRMEFWCPDGATTIELLGKHHSYALGTVGRQVARLLAEDAQARLAA